MKTISTIQKISQAVSRVQKISSKNVSLPVLENILLVAESNTLTFRATNLHVGVEASLSVKTESEGVVAVNLTVFSNIINNLKGEGKITLETKESTLTIETEDSQMEIKIFAHDDFPTLPRPEEEDCFTLPIQEFTEGLRSVMYSASQSDIKPEISSVYIYAKGSQLCFVATDSFRLAEKKISISQVEDFPGIIVPIKNVQECIKVFSGDEGSVKVYVQKNQLSIQSSFTYFTTRLVDGNYPDYQQIIPDSFETEAVVLKDELIQTLRLVNVFSNSFNQVSITIVSEKGALRISSRNTDIGENNSSLDAAVNGENQDLFVNHKYISDMLSSVAADSISFSVVGKNKPFVIKGVGDESFLYLIMPMNR